jgi:hypothetical protein
MATEQRKLRGLWEVMASQADNPPTATEGPPTAPPQAPTEPPPESAASGEKPKSLWAVMSGRSAPPVVPAPPPPALRPAVVPSVPELNQEPEPQSVAAATRTVRTGPTEPSVRQSSVPRPFVRDEEDSPAERWRQRVGDVSVGGMSRSAVVAGALGLISLPLSFLSVLPGVWAFIPAMIVGCAAVIVGLFSLGEIGRSRGRKTGRYLAVLGVVAGCAGMFLGPLVVGPPHESGKPKQSGGLRAEG